MSTAPNTPSLRHSIAPWHRVVFVVALVAVVGLGLGVWWLVQYRQRIRREIAQELTLIRQAGLPTNADELDHWYARPVTNDYTALYTNALAQLVQPANDFTWLKVFDEFHHAPTVLTNEVKTSIRAFIQTNALPLAMLEQVQETPACLYPVSWHCGSPEWQFSLAKVRIGSQLLALRAMLCADEGQAEQATRSLVAGLALAKSWQSSPVLLYRTIGLHSASAQVSTLEWCLGRTRFTDGQLAKLSLMLRELDDADGMRRVWIAERAWANGLIEAVQTGTLTNQVKRSRVEWFNQLVLDRERLVVLRTAAEWVRVVSLPTKDRLLAARECTRLAKVVAKSSFLFGYDSQRQVHHLAWDLTMLAHRRAALAAVGVARHQQATGLLPTELPASPEDPFTGTPLRYRNTEEGFVVYSVGLNGRDDGGVEMEALTVEPARTKDITFTVRTPR